MYLLQQYSGKGLIHAMQTMAQKTGDCCCGGTVVVKNQPEHNCSTCHIKKNQIKQIRQINQIQTLLIKFFIDLAQLSKLYQPRIKVENVI